MSSCSVYGAAGDSASREGDRDESGDGVRPLQGARRARRAARWRRRVLARRSCATPPRTARRRGSASTSSSTTSSATRVPRSRRSACRATAQPWRPFVHILDIAQAVERSLAAPTEVIHGEIFNVGSDELNYQVRQIAEHRRLDRARMRDRRRAAGRRQAQLSRRLHQDPHPAAGVRMPLDAARRGPRSCSTSFDGSTSTRSSTARAGTPGSSRSAI